MAKKPIKKKTPKKPRVNKIPLWYKAYTDENNPTTFLNKTASAKAAGYKANSENAFQVIGYQNFIKLQPDIEKWLDEHKFSLAALKKKHAELLETHKTVYQKIKGQVYASDLPKNVKIVAAGQKMMGLAGGADGDEPAVYDDGDTLLAINVAEPEIQRKALDMAYKVKGEYAAEKKELTGPGGGPIETKMTDFPTEPMTVKEWEKLRNEAEEQRKANPEPDIPDPKNSTDAS